jgi:hypothetical protein
MTQETTLRIKIEETFTNDQLITLLSTCGGELYDYVESIIKVRLKKIEREEWRGQ